MTFSATISCDRCGLTWERTCGGTVDIDEALSQLADEGNWHEENRGECQPA
jgi:hypothetical protein